MNKRAVTLADLTIKSPYGPDEDQHACLGPLTIYAYRGGYDWWHGEVTLEIKNGSAILWRSPKDLRYQTPEDALQAALEAAQAWARPILIVSTPEDERAATQ